MLVLSSPWWKFTEERKHHNDLFSSLVKLQRLKIFFFLVYELDLLPRLLGKWTLGGRVSPPPRHLHRKLQNAPRPRLTLVYNWTPRWHFNILQHQCFERVMEENLAYSNWYFTGNKLTSYWEHFLYELLELLK